MPVEDVIRMRSTSKIRPSTGWRLEEVASAGRENLDPEHVALRREDGCRRWGEGEHPEEVMLDLLRTKIAAARLRNVDVVASGFLTYGHQGPPVRFIYSR